LRAKGGGTATGVAFVGGKKERGPDQSKTLGLRPTKQTNASGVRGGSVPTAKNTRPFAEKREPPPKKKRRTFMHSWAAKTSKRRDGVLGGNAS